jgi:hypothetical protein
MPHQLQQQPESQPPQGYLPFHQFAFAQTLTFPPQQQSHHVAPTTHVYYLDASTSYSGPTTTNVMASQPHHHHVLQQHSAAPSASHHPPYCSGALMNNNASINSNNSSAPPFLPPASMTTAMTQSSSSSGYPFMMHLGPHPSAMQQPHYPQNGTLLNQVVGMSQQPAATQSITHFHGHHTAVASSDFSMTNAQQNQAQFLSTMPPAGPTVLATSAGTLPRGVPLPPHQWLPPHHVFGGPSAPPLMTMGASRAAAAGGMSVGSAVMGYHPQGAAFAHQH